MVLMDRKADGEVDRVPNNKHADHGIHGKHAISGHRKRMEEFTISGLPVNNGLTRNFIIKNLEKWSRAMFYKVEAVVGQSGTRSGHCGAR